MSKLFDDLLKDENYKKLFEKLSEEDAVVLQESMRKLTEDFEAKLLKPLKTILEKK